MNADFIRNYCLSFPEATENLQWGDDLCFKFRGKIFATLALTSVPPKLCFKCTPEVFAELTERSDIHPAPYVGRYYWVITDGLGVLRRDELTESIRRSYELVKARAPKAGSANARNARKRGGKKAASRRSQGLPPRKRQR